MDADRRRAVAERLVRQRKPGSRSPATERSRSHVLRQHPRRVSRAGRRPRAASPPLGGRARRASIPLTETQRKLLIALCRPIVESNSTTPATNPQIAAEVYLSVDAVKAHMHDLFDAVRPRRSAAEREAPAARRDRARRRACSPATTSDARTSACDRDRGPRADADAIAVGERDRDLRGDRRRVVVHHRAVRRAEVAHDDDAVAAPLEHRVQAGDARVRRRAGQVDLGIRSSGCAAAPPDPVLAIGEGEAPLRVVGRKRHAGDREAVELGAVGGDDRLPTRRAGGGPRKSWPQPSQ